VSIPPSNSNAILVTHTSMNPSQPEKAEFYDVRQTALILRRESGRLIVATTFCGSAGFIVGEKQRFHHDQSQRDMGMMVITGIINYFTGDKLGEALDRTIPHFVFK
jgi:hypothetical protein